MGAVSETDEAKSKLDRIADEWELVCIHVLGGGSGEECGEVNAAFEVDHVRLPVEPRRRSPATGFGRASSVRNARPCFGNPLPILWWRPPSKCHQQPPGDDGNQSALDKQPCGGQRALAM